MVKELLLTQGFVAVVDDDDYEYLSQWKWLAINNRQRRKVYAGRTKWLGNGKKTTVLMHREILGFPPGKEIDHIDGDGLHNTKGNLRVCSTSENGRNRSFQRNNTSGFKGVFWRKKSKKWEAAINIAGKTRYLGKFSSAEEAARAYDATARELHGEYASLNFDNTPPQPTSR